MNVLVTGAGASGGFLMTRLMTAFEGYRQKGLSQGDVFSLHSKHFFSGNCKQGVVRKADVTYILCGCHSPWEEQQADLIREMKSKGTLAVVHIVRNGLDVLRRRPAYRVGEIWMDSARQYLSHPDLPNIVVRYESLCTHPDKVQDDIAEATGLRKMKLFSQYPRFVVPPYTHGVKANHKLRPIDTGCIHGGEVKGCPEKLLNRKDEFDSYMERLGYA